MSYKATHRPIRVSDESVVRGYLEYRQQFDAGLWQETADDVLKKMTKKPMGVIWRAMNRAYDRGFIECGVSLRTGWATEKGIALLSDASGVCRPAPGNERVGALVAPCESSGDPQ